MNILKVYNKNFLFETDSCVLELYKDLDSFDFTVHDSLSFDVLRNFLDIVIENKIDKLVFIGNDILLSDLIRFLHDHNIYIDIYFHITNNLYKYISSFVKIKDLYKLFNFSFITSCEAHKKVINKLLKSDNVFVIPPQVSYFKQRLDVRAKYKISDNAIVFCFYDDIGTQSRLLDLLQLFKKFRSMFNKNSYLLYGGPCRDNGNLFLGRPSKLNESINKIRLLSEGMDNVIDVGELNKEERAGLFSSADIYINLSIFNDRGYSPFTFEATKYCNVVLSDWGPHKDLASKENVKFVKIKEESGVISLNLQSALKLMFSNTKRIIPTSDTNQLLIEDIMNNNNSSTLQDKPNLEILNSALLERPFSPFSKIGKVNTYTDEYLGIYESFFR